MREKFQDKLYNYEVKPTEKVWGKITNSLDESYLSDAFPTRLYNLERTPPAETWEKVSYNLTIEKRIPVAKKRSFSPFIRYAAAAIILGLISFITIRIIDNRSLQAPLVKNKIIVPAASEPIIKNTVKESLALPDISEESRQAQDDAALEASKHTYAKQDPSSKSRIMALNPEFITMPVEISRNLNTHNPEETYRDICYNSINSAVHIESDKYNIEDRYVMLITPEGNIFRMSKKWGDLLCCVSGSEQDEQCKDQLHNWRTKMASAPVVPSSGNFLDILHLVNSLKEN